MISFRTIIVSSVILMLAIGLTSGCKHEPFPTPPPGNGEPQDTTGNDTTEPVGKPCHPDTIYYQRDIQPILTSSCAYAGCHDPNTAQNGVILNNYNSVMATADVRPGDLSGSDLYEVITDSDPDDRMPQPPNNPLPASQIETIRKWILQGAQNLTCQDCDSTDLRYSTNIKAIFDRSCITCHRGANPPNGRKLTTFEEVEDAMLNTNLLQRINHAASVPPMPPGGKMDPCSIEKIEKWFQEGMPQ